MAVQVNVYEARNQLSKLLERAEAGEEIIIARAGRPVVTLVPVRRSRVDREPGSLRGKIRIAPDFDETPVELVDLFYDGPIFPKREGAE